MKPMFRYGGVLLIAAGLALAACADAGPNSAGAPQAIENYFKALVAKDVNGVIATSCAAWEETAKTEVDSFGAVTPALEGLACTASGTDAEGTLVTCQGKIKVTYNNEQQELPLDGRTYLAVEEGGEWRMCGRK